MPMPKNKCKGCTDRYVGCQSSCESYLTYAAECKRIRNNRQAEYVYNSYLNDCNTKACRIHFGRSSY